MKASEAIAIMNERHEEIRHDFWNSKHGKNIEKQIKEIAKKGGTGMVIPGKVWREIEEDFRGYIIEKILTDDGFALWENDRSHSLSWGG